MNCTGTRVDQRPRRGTRWPYRRHTIELKRAVVEQSRQPGASVSRLAHPPRHQRQADIRVAQGPARRSLGRGCVRADHPHRHRCVGRARDARCPSGRARSADDRGKGARLTVEGGLDGTSPRGFMLCYCCDERPALRQANLYRGRHYRHAARLRWARCARSDTIRDRSL